MLSKKLTFSLTSLIALLAMGLILTPAMAGEFEAYFEQGEFMVDVSSDDGLQVRSGRDRATVYPENADAALQLTLSVRFDKIVQLGPDVTADTVKPDRNPLQLSDFTVDAYDDLGRSLGGLSLNVRLNDQGNALYPADTGYATATAIATLAFSTPQTVNIADPGELPGQQFRLTIDYEALENAYDTTTGGPFEIHTLLFTLAKGAVNDASIAALSKYRKDPKADNEPDTSKGPKFLQVDLVNEDEGDAHYAEIVSIGGVSEVKASNVSADAGPDEIDVSVPGVVSVSRVEQASGVSAVATKPFDVRIVLTEEPASFTKDHIMVLNGTAADPVALIPVAPGDAGIRLEDFPGKRYEDADTPVATPTGEDDLTQFPEPTGRDNKYHLYTVTITPKDNFAGNVTVWVKPFDDKVLPRPNTYKALTHAQILADTLTTSALFVRNVRVLREVVSVPVKTGKTEATTAQDTRDTAIKNEPNSIRLPEKFYIPANGYLVLARGKADHNGIVDSGLEKYSDDANTTLKTTLTAAQVKYNIKYEFDFPYPANDLDSFFRNGGTVSLIHQNVAGNTAGAEKKKGYAGANDTAYTAGQVIISEIMWGQDAGLAAADQAKSQYIELHNTTSSMIGIDKNEWVLAFHGPSGGTSALGTVIDTVGNNPATGYWQVPGGGGVTVASAATPTVTDLVSMSRIPGTTDGTAAASWAMSKTPSANISGRRVGTPGAANVYVEPVKVVTPEPEPTPMAPVAKGSDIMISEIMVASNDGRLPQWIELANVSGAEVSLSGWSVDVDNDATDADVVAESVNVTLGDVVVGKDQVVLIVTKTGRNSGVGSGADAKGTLREDRIVNVQSQVSPTDARYSLISDMAFKIALLPPQKGGVVERGDVVGNLNMGWELPMAEGNSRSSLIRREMGTAAEIMGTDAAGWVLASDTSLVGAYTNTYYGNDEDMGTPGYDAGGSLPVELSKFGAKRDPLTDQVIVTWETQSELNNAGFFIKRSQQKDSKFVAVNPTLIPGAGTTSEKQSYTYTDTTAKPNIVYYYQIEDVSLDGHRQTLTRAHRLKGHIGAAGKATTTWGELKTSRQQ